MKHKRPTRHITARISGDLVQRLRHILELTGWNESQLIRIALDYYLKCAAGTNDPPTNIAALIQASFNAKMAEDKAAQARRTANHKLRDLTQK